MRIGGIGPAGSCSTVMNFVMDGLPGVAGVGDLQILLDRDALCSECLTSCPVFDDQLRAAVRSDPLRSWEIVSAKAGADHVYLQSGSHIQYGRIGDPDVAVVLYRDVRAWVASHALWEANGWKFRTELPDAQPIADLQFVQGAIAHWVQFYEANLGWLSDRRWVSFDTDRFIDDPERGLRSLCSHLDVSYDAGALQFWDRPHHKIGGRFNVTRGKRSRFGNRLARDDSWKRYLTVAALELIESSRDIDNILRVLHRENCAPLEESCEF